MGAIELIQSLFVALLWLLGSAAVLALALSLPPVQVRAVVGSFHLDEETPVAWGDIPFRVHVRGLWGALHLYFERSSGGERRSGWRLLWFERPVRPAGVRRKASKAGPKREPRRGRRFGLRELRRLLPEIRWLFAQARRRMKLEARGELVYGLPDPFATSLVHLLTLTQPIPPELRLQPDYTQGTLRGTIDLSLRAYPWQALLVLARASFRPGVKPLWWPRARKALRF